MRSFSLALIISVLGIASPSTIAKTPQEPTPSEPFQTTIQMRETAWNEFKESDKQLNTVFNELIKSLETSRQKANLREAQRTWLKFRDKQADFEASLYEGGSIKPQIHTGCLTALTQIRTKELQAILKNEDQ